MAIVVGSKGLEEVDLIIPQGASFNLDVIQKTDDGETIDHSASTPNMAFQETKNGLKVNHKLDSCCTCSDESVRINIPYSITENLPIGKMSWDIFVTTSLGERTRLCYGKVTIVDTYALDEE